MIEARFMPGCTTCTAKGLYQWDYGQELKINGVNLPSVIQVHFSNYEKNGSALRMLGTTMDGVTTVKIPDELLTGENRYGNFSVYAFVYVTTENSGETVYKITMPVQSRPKPEDYTDPGTDDPFADTIEQVKQYADQAEQSAQQVQDVLNQASETFVLKKQGIENAGKALVIDDAGNVVPGKSGADLDALEKIAIKPTETGTDIVAEDSADWRLLDLSAQGWTEQTVTTGKNLSYLEIGSYSGTSLQKIDQDNRARIFEPFNIEKTVTISVKEGYKIYARKFLDESLIAEGSLLQSQTIVYDQTFNKLTVVVRKDDDGLITKEDILDMNFQIEYGDSVTLYEPYSGGYPSPRPEIRTNQLFDASKIPTKSESGITVENNDNGSFTVSGSGNSSSSFGANYRISSTYVKLKQGKLYLNINGDITNPYFFVQLLDSSGEVIKQVRTNISSVDLTDDDISNTDLIVFGFYYAAGEEIKTGTIRPMVYQDGDGSWEPYTVEEWEQPIVNAGKRNDESQKYEYVLKIIGKNFLNIKENLNLNIYGVNLKTSNSVINLNGTATSSGGRTNKLTDIMTLKKGTYVFSTEEVYKNIAFYLNDKNNKDLYKVDALTGKTKIEVKDDIDVYLGVNVSSGNSYNVGCKVQLEIGEEQTEWEAGRIPKQIILTSDRPLTKWDRLEKRDGKWGWVYKSAETEFDGNDISHISKYSDNKESVYTFIVIIDQKNKGTDNFYCNKFIKDNDVYSKDKSYIISGHTSLSNIYINVKKDDVDDFTIQSFGKWLQENPIKFLYETKAEEWVELSPEEQDVLNTLTTYYPTTVIQNDAGMEMTVRYVADPENFLKKNYQEKLERIDVLNARMTDLENLIVKEN